MGKYTLMDAMRDEAERRLSLHRSSATSEVLPCPHCASSDIRFTKHRAPGESPTGVIWSMCCYRCGATFPNRYKKELLVEAWNTRAASSPARVVGDREAVIHAICPHIKQWVDIDPVLPVICQKCPATVQTSMGEGVQACRLNAEAAANDMLAILNLPAPADGGWLPIESAPKDGERILLGWRGDMSAEGFWHEGSENYWKLPGFYFADDDVLTGKPCSPNCWMPLPTPPAAPPTSHTSNNRGGE